MRVKLWEETIKRPLEECPCDWCGFPLYVGDRVLYDLDGGATYCSERCAKDDTFDAGKAAMPGTLPETRSE